MWYRVQGWVSYLSRDHQTHVDWMDYTLKARGPLHAQAEVLSRAEEVLRGQLRADPQAQWSEPSHVVVERL